MFPTEEFTAHSTVYHSWDILYPLLSTDSAGRGVVLYISRRQSLYTHTKHFSVTYIMQNIIESTLNMYQSHTMKLNSYTCSLRIA